MNVASNFSLPLNSSPSSEVIYFYTFQIPALVKFSNLFNLLSNNGRLSITFVTFHIQLDYVNIN